jgi:hypothetical protein
MMLSSLFLNRSFRCSKQCLFDLCFVFALSQSLIMSPKTFNVAAECFGDPDGPCSLAVAKKAGVQIAPTSEDSDIVPLVVSGSPPAPAKVRTVCGHSVSKTAAKKHLGASTVFYAPPAALQAKLKAELLELNPPAETTRECPLARLTTLRTRPVGGILLAVKHWDTQKAGYGAPVLQVVANPAVASFTGDGKLRHSHFLGGVARYCTYKTLHLPRCTFW